MGMGWCSKPPQPVVFTGLVRLRASPFPKLQGTEYVLNITATDDNASGGPHPLTSTAQVVVKIDDVNNNKPVFQKVNKWASVTCTGPCKNILTLLALQVCSQWAGWELLCFPLGPVISSYSIPPWGFQSLVCSCSKAALWSSVCSLNHPSSLAFQRVRPSETLLEIPCGTCASHGDSCLCSELVPECSRMPL